MKNIDCTVTCLERVYKITTSNWARPIPMRRPTNGIVFFLNGSIEYQFSDSVILAQKGDIMIFPKDSVYCGMKQTDENSFYVVDFEIQESDILDALSLPRRITSLNFAQIEHLFSDLLAAWDQESSHGTLSCKAKLYDLLNVISYSNHSSSNDYPRSFAQMVNYIQNNYQDASLSVNTLCSNFQTSPSQIRRLFSKHLGMSPIAFIQDTRIRHAKALLWDNIPIQDIAENCGYSSVYYFSRIFKQTTGFSPSDYRRK